MTPDYHHNRFKGKIGKTFTLGLKKNTSKFFLVLIFMYEVNYKIIFKEKA